MGRPPAGRGVIIGIEWLAVAGLIFVTAVATVAAGAWALASLEQHHEGGDPGGRVFAELVPVSHAVPAGVHVISRDYREAAWEECVGAPGSGWEPAMVSVNFSTSMPPDQLASRVGQRLERGGWLLDPAGTSAAEAIWRKRLPGGTTATAVLHSSDQRNDWWLYASAPPLGEEFPNNC